ncbi:hypothetical protein [Kosakonia radicincitans]|uniref:hypothetical protein n=1 Tax=Kosakonia radicincitans TaxID=283686 RepID=UPI001D078F61|nr:hypothetical protein [Kosakonia radicincitans]
MSNNQYGGKPRIRVTSDGLMNVMTGMGTDRDRRMFNRFQFGMMQDFGELELGDSYKLVTGESVEISGVLTPDDQIALPLELTGASAWSTVNSATITASLSGAGAARVAVTRDLTDYVVFDGTAWISIGGWLPIRRGRKN